MIFRKPKQLLGTKNMSSGTFIFGTEYIYIYIKERHYFCMIKLSFQKIAAQKRRELIK